MKNRAKLIGIAPQLIVKDVQQTADYYREVLGFDIIGLVGTPLVYAMVQRDGFQIHFGKADGAVFHTNEQSRKINTDFIIWVPEIDAFYDEVTGKGAEILESITTRLYGSREFVIRDCNGYRITVGD